MSEYCTRMHYETPRTRWYETGVVVVVGIVSAIVLTVMIATVCFIGAENTQRQERDQLRACLESNQERILCSPSGGLIVRNT